MTFGSKFACDPARGNSDRVAYVSVFPAPFPYGRSILSVGIPHGLAALENAMHLRRRCHLRPRERTLDSAVSFVAYMLQEAEHAPLLGVLALWTIHLPEQLSTPRRQIS